MRVKCYCIVNDNGFTWVTDIIILLYFIVVNASASCRVYDVRMLIITFFLH